MSKTKNGAKSAKRITVVVEGKQYRRLEAVAKALNTLSWLDGDNSAESVFWAFAWPWTEKDLESCRELADDIESGMELCDDILDAPESLRAEREAELKAALDEVRKLDI